MKRFYSTFFFLFVLICPLGSLFAQNSDTTTLIKMIKRGEEIYAEKPDSSMLLFKNGETYANKLLLTEKNKKSIFKIKQQKALAINNQGFLLYDENVNEALKKFLLALQLREEIIDSQYLSESYNNLATIYKSLSQLEKALSIAYKSLKFDEKYNNKHLGYSLHTIAAIYYDLKDPENAISYNLKALKIREELNDLNQIAISLTNLSNAYILNKEYIKAQQPTKKAISIWEEKKSIKSLAAAYSNYGAIYQNTGKKDSAMFYILKSITIREKLNDNNRLAISYSNIARLYYDSKELDKAEEYGLKSFALAEKMKFPSEIEGAAEVLRRVYDGKKDDANAYKYYKIYIEMRDSIQVIENKKFAYKQQIQYEYDKKDALTQAELAKRELQIFKNNQSLLFLETENEVKELSLSKSSLELIAKKNESMVQQKEIEVLNKSKALKESEARENEAALKQQRILTITLAGIGILVLAFLLVAVRGYRQKQKANEIITKQKHEVENQKHIIEEKHKEITDSINYAERIQRSFLATTELLDNNLKDHFVFFQPKDVVSGDFYWANKLNNGHFALVTADSTGHGVPGAIMSILNISSLEKAIEQGLCKPSEILNSTRKTIIERLKKDGSAEGGKDGMDASLICFDFANQKFTYAAANNPIWVVRDNGLIELSPDKMPVGKHDKDHIPFTQHEFQIKKGDVVYTLTDGLPDQFGGPKGKKFMYKQVKELLVSIAHLAMKEQNTMLKSSLKSWKGDLEQVDDVCLIGIRV